LFAQPWIMSLEEARHGEANHTGPDPLIPARRMQSAPTQQTGNVSAIKGLFSGNQPANPSGPPRGGPPRGSPRSRPNRVHPPNVQPGQTPSPRGQPPPGGQRARGAPPRAFSPTHSAPNLAVSQPLPPQTNHSSNIPREGGNPNGPNRGVPSNRGTVPIPMRGMDRTRSEISKSLGSVQQRPRPEGGRTPPMNYDPPPAHPNNPDQKLSKPLHKMSKTDSKIIRRQQLESFSDVLHNEELLRETVQKALEERLTSVRPGELSELPESPEKPQILASKPNLTRTQGAAHIAPPQIPPKPQRQSTDTDPPSPVIRPEEEPLQWPATAKFENPDDPSVILYDETAEKTKIRAATIEKLVEKATDAKAESAFQQAFLLTYRSILPPYELLGLLEERFAMPLPEGSEAALTTFKQTQQKPIQIRVCQLLKTWITQHFNDFESDKELQDRFRNFVTEMITPAHPKLGNNLETIFTRQLKGEYEREKKAQFADPPPKPIIPTKQNPGILDINAKELARQLTIIESNLYRAILPRECIGLAWSKKDAKERAPNILAMIDRFNVVSSWVVCEVVKPESFRQRVETMNHFIKIAKQCRRLNNFNASMEILAGLEDSAVHRLKTHWSELSRKSINTYEELKAILSSDRSYHSLRSVLKLCNGAVIPYMGMYQTDLTFIEDGNPDKIGDLHNFSKRILVSNVIQEIKQYQQAPYHLEPVPVVQNYLSSIAANLLDKETCYQKSLAILPRGGLKNPPASSNNPPASPQVIPASPEVNSKTSAGKSLNNSSSSSDSDSYGELEYRPGYLFNQPDSDSNIRLVKEPGHSHESPKIIAATLEKLIERVTYHIYPDPHTSDTFLLTYRSFTTGKRVLELLLMRYDVPYPMNSSLADKYKAQRVIPVQSRVFNLLKNWVDKYPYDFLAERSLAQMLFDFSENSAMQGNALGRISQTLKAKMELINQGKSAHKKVVSKTQSTIPLLPMLRSPSDSSQTSILDFYPEEIARQLCLIAHKVYSKIDPRELLNTCSWQHDNMGRLRNLSKFTAIFTGLRNWLIHLISSSSLADRRDWIQLFIRVAAYSSEFCNYQVLCGIMTGLSTNDVRVSSLWDNIDPQLSEKYTQLSYLLSGASSLRTFREFLPACEEACVPAVEAYLKEIASIEERERDFVEGQLINMQKRTKFSACILEFLQYRASTYTFESHSWLREFLLEKIHKYADREAFDDQTPLSEQLASMDSNQIKTSIRAAFMDDKNLRQQLVSMFTSAFRQSEELQSASSEIEGFQSSAREDLRSLSSIWKHTGSSLQLAVDDYLRNRFPDLPLTDWSAQDDDGLVYGWPEKISIQVIDNGELNYIVYSKNQFDNAELATVLRMKKFFQENSPLNKYPDGPSVLAFVGFIPNATADVAKRKGIEVVSFP